MTEQEYPSVIYIDDINRANALACLRIIGGTQTSYDKRKQYGFTCWINSNEYWLDKASIKLLRHKCIKAGMSIRQFHNAFEAALGIELNSTLL